MRKVLRNLRKAWLPALSVPVISLVSTPSHQAWHPSSRCPANRALLRHVSQQVLRDRPGELHRERVPGLLVFLIPGSGETDPRREVGSRRAPRPTNALALFYHRTPMMFQMGPIRSINPASSPAAVLTGNPFHSEGSGVATSTFTRLAAASVLAIRSLMRALVRWRLCPRRYCSNRVCRPPWSAPHTPPHHRPQTHRRRERGEPWRRAAGHFPDPASIHPAGGSPRWSGLPTMWPRATWTPNRPSRVRVGPRPACVNRP